MRDLGLQACQTLISAKDPLKKLQDLAQNFPSHATALTSIKVKDELREELMKNLESGVGASS